MNLHILPDSKFSDHFYNNLKEAGLLKNNKLVIRTNKQKLLYITHDIPFASLYSAKFESIVGNVYDYDRVFIHQFYPLMYRWVANHSFRELNWMVWGTDLYNLPFVSQDFYEPITRNFVKNNQTLNDLLYRIKVYLTNMPYRKKAYAKVDHVLTWMKSEFLFAKQAISGLRADHHFFFYENQIPYQALDKMDPPATKENGSRLKIIIGNSGTPTNNHLDVIKKIDEAGIRADLLIPVSYGDKAYINFLKKNIPYYENGKIELIERFMRFDEYVQFLRQADALVMNHIRPQGYGNIFMMMYMDKPVFLNEKNLSLPDLNEARLHHFSMTDLKNLEGRIFHTDNKGIILGLLSHEKLLNTYRNLFA